jgi:hypothetical protein
MHIRSIRTIVMVRFFVPENISSWLSFIQFHGAFQHGLGACARLFLLLHQRHVKHFVLPDLCFPTSIQGGQAD